jgi:hypothetical protein
VSATDNLLSALGSVYGEEAGLLYNDGAAGLSSQGAVHNVLSHSVYRSQEGAVHNVQFYS